LDFIKKSVKSNPKYDKGWLRKADIEKALGEVENAFESYKIA
jgi:Tfp pilus assembly protein PilF